MNEDLQIGEVILELAILFGATYMLASLLTRARIPGILAALLVAMEAHYTPLGERLLSGESHRNHFRDRCRL